jgi:DNA-binding LacI/PurR family transcriptional regulator
MAHIRRAHARTAGERLAFVWVHTTRTQAERDPFLRNVFLGARRRAEQSGFALEEFWTSDPGMTERRLEQIIQSRGIVGVVLSPITSSEASLALDWTWQSFAVAVIGNVTWTPELHHAGHHHYLGMRMALSELAQLGCTRPAALIEVEINERAKRAWEAAFLTHHPARAKAVEFARVLAREETGIAAWLRARKPDALIVSGTDLLDTPGLRGVCRELKLPLVTLHWDKNTPADIGGVDQCYDRIAAHAVDLVVAQLNSNETGVPDLPRIMLFSGRWVAPRVPRRSTM